MKQLKTILPSGGGRDQKGRVSVRHRGGRSKRFLRTIDFKRNKLNISAKVVGIEYDPNRTARIALLNYSDGEKRYILAPLGLEVGQTVLSAEEAEVKVGNCLPLGKIPVGTMVHNLELTPGRGGALIRSAGAAAQILASEGRYVAVKLPSGEVRKILNNCFAVVGQLGEAGWKLEKFGKAGAKRWRGIRPTVRGVAQNPRSHPHGGGEGRSGIGMPGPKTFAGRPAVGKTRKKRKYSDKMIVSRRKK